MLLLLRSGEALPEGGNMTAAGMVGGFMTNTLKFLSCVFVLSEPEFWNLNPDLPDQVLPQLYGRERLFGEVDRLLAEGETWPVVSRSHGVVVRSRFSQEYRRSLYFAKAVMPAKPKEMLDVFWKDGLDIPKWNPTALAVEVVKDLDDQTRITWQSTKAQVAGLIGSRDFVNLNFWRSSGEGTIDIVYSNATWPSKPPTSDYVRGMNGASGMRFSPLPGGKECTMTWVFNANMDFSAFIPNGILTRVIPSSLIDYLGHLRKNVSR